MFGKWPKLCATCCLNILILLLMRLVAFRPRNTLFLILTSCCFVRHLERAIWSTDYPIYSICDISAAVDIMILGVESKAKSSFNGMLKQNIYFSCGTEEICFLLNSISRADSTHIWINNEWLRQRSHVTKNKLVSL